MPKDSANVLIGLTQALQASGTFSAFNPSISTIRRGNWASDAEHIADIRDGEKIAGALVLATGIVVAFLIDDFAPVWTAIIVDAVMVGIYEWAIATRKATPTERMAE